MESNNDDNSKNSVETDENKVEERAVENSIINQQHSIIQTDETITVIVDESFVNEVEDIGEEILTPSSTTTTTSTTTDEKKQRKKSVKFESDENIKKFIVGEEIVDQENPFKDDENLEQKRFIIKKKSKSPSGGSELKNTKTKTIVTINNGSAVSSNRNNSSQENNSDFITKEEILRQSKYVPVYIKNPDRVLTYDKSVLEALKHKSLKVQQKRGPVPMPRKSITTNGRKSDDKNNKKHTTTATNNEKKSQRIRKLSNYPELSNIKVRLCS
jgi:hypothetical protein